MKKAIFIILGCIFFGIIAYGIFAALLVRPSKEAPPAITQQIVFPTSTDVPELTQVQEAQVQESIDSSFHDNVPDSDGIVLSHIAVVNPYALADWTDENIGGQVLMRYAEDGWVVLIMDGGAFDFQTLRSAGVPEAVARDLLKAMQGFY